MPLDETETPEVEETEIEAEVVAVVETETDVEYAEEDQLVVQIGEEEPEEQEKAPAWVNDLRKSNREKDKRIKELEALANGEQVKAKIVAKPTLEGCDYDQAEFEKQLEAWYDTRRAVDEEEKAKIAAKEREDQEWQAKLKKYEEGKSTLKVRDYEDVESTVLDTFSVTQQGAAIQVAKNPALLVYALGKNPKRAKELAAITNIADFIYAVAEVELSLKVNTKGAPPPEKKMASSTTGISATVDGTLERLREEAAKTGDYRKVVAHRREKRG